MNARLFPRPVVWLLVASLASPAAFAQEAATSQKSRSTDEQKTYEPEEGQAGKDVVWVPTPDALVEKMLEMAQVTPKDYVMDLGSGDGRTVIAAAKRGATAVGIEYNPDMVELSRRNAQAAGVSDKATFIKADLFETDFSKAHVITMFLLPSINLKLRPTLLDLKPGTRIVSNSFSMEEWEADQTETINEDCTSWCTALLWIVPAKVEGTWVLGPGELRLTQNFQYISGALGSQSITQGRLHGDEITFKAGNLTYTGRVEGDTMSGTITGGRGDTWTATRKSRTDRILARAHASEAGVEDW
jgi:precorrin-6B methylase 2